MIDQAVDPSQVLWLGETSGFWIQTGAISISAIVAIFILYTNSHQSKKRATVDLILHNNTNPQLTLARKEIAKMHLKSINFSQYAAADLSAHPENDHILSTVNNYEFYSHRNKRGRA